MLGMLLTGGTTSFSVEYILQTATSVLTWFITSFGSIFAFFMEHPGLLIWLVVSLVGSALVYFRNLV